MSTSKSSDSDDNLLEPLLQQQDGDSSDTVIVNEDWISSPCPTSGKNIINKSDSPARKGKYNKTLLSHCKKPAIRNSANNLFIRRKRAFVILAAGFLFLIYMMNRNTDERIPVIRHSHVPGMKALKIFAPITTAEQQQTTPVAVTLKPEQTTRTARSTDGGKSIPLNSTAMPSLAPTTHRVVNATTTASTKPTTTSSNLSTTFSTNSTILPPPSGYLVWSDKCKMPNIDPYTPEVMQFFRREKYEACSSSTPLTRVIYNSTANKYVLLINEDQIKHYTHLGWQPDCCYQVIERKSSGKKADKEVSLSECLGFRKPVFLPNTADNILVKCKSKIKQVYSNGHPMMPERAEIRERLDQFKPQGKKPISVLMVGIDSISRINLIRAMPKTAQYLYDNEWFEMSGYNKMDDNTFPNLMAILTGFNQSTAFHKCNPTHVGALDKCPLIWKNFQENGYVTAYAEDESSISTFNYLKMGFEKPPVDYYLRPFLISAEHNLRIKTKSNLIFCLGYQHSADYIYDYAIELATRYRNEPYFGLFWANTFSHNSISDCSSMDVKMVDYLKQFAKRGILDKSIVIFFSDHGMRFGPTRRFLSGHLEERLPFMFIWLPPDLKNSHPEFVNALSVNKNRLTNPYDIHMTLKHILEISGRTPKLPPAMDCPKCQTLLKPVPHSRSCDDAGIEDHWCTCIPYNSIYKESSVVSKIAEFTVNYINNYVAEYKNGTVADKCAVLNLSNVQSAYRALHACDIGSNVTIETYRIIFTTKPNNALYESTVRYAVETDVMQITGSISRLDSYASDSYCISDGGAKKYCSCGRGSHHHAVRAPAGK